jgi:hypothetical protein
VRTIFEASIQVAGLGLLIWVVTFQLPRARREQDVLAITCSLLTALLGLAAWLWGVSAHSHLPASDGAWNPPA